MNVLQTCTVTYLSNVFIKNTALGVVSNTLKKTYNINNVEYNYMTQHGRRVFPTLNDIIATAFSPSNNEQFAICSESNEQLAMFWISLSF